MKENESQGQIKGSERGRKRLKDGERDAREGGTREKWREDEGDCERER
jgi:hypothetical protein